MHARRLVVSYPTGNCAPVHFVVVGMVCSCSMHCRPCGKALNNMKVTCCMLHGAQAMLEPIGMAQEHVHEKPQPNMLAAAPLPSPLLLVEARPLVESKGQKPAV